MSYILVGLLSATAGWRPAAAELWRPAPGPLQTRWTKTISPENPWPEYPRPQMVRTLWLNLNGLWDYAVTPRSVDAAPEEFIGKILVPFPIESQLSGVGRMIKPDEVLWYRTRFSVPKKWNGQRVLLHFGAVDFEATVWLNGRKLGSHRGGYEPFSFEVTELIRFDTPNELIVRVWDPTDQGPYPRGKQVLKPHGIWYTPTTGIWQTVWLEPVPAAYIAGIKIRPDIHSASVTLDVSTRLHAGRWELVAEIWEKGVRKSRAAARIESTGHREERTLSLTLHLEDPRFWTPDDPYLYDLVVRLEQGGAVIDQIGSYFGMREISLCKDQHGFVRLCLNGEPLFQFGLLDQGFWPDGLYTAPCDEALRYDIEVTKQLGCNTIRKHVKIEPERWYAWCDHLGVLVWQDMPSGANTTPEARNEFERELVAMIRNLFNHPSIIMWVPFNEGWGQYDTERIVGLIEQIDPTRLINNASGWTDRGVGHVHDIHAYPGPAAPEPESDRAGVLGEFGGLGLPLRGHTWQAERNWGYRSFTTPEELTEAYLELVRKLRRLIGSKGIAAAIYTQTTDVEIEVNGMMTYDREIIKMDLARVREANMKLYGPPPPPPQVEVLLPDGRKEGQLWWYTFEEPGNDWTAPEFKADGWKQGLSGFGRKGTPGAVVRTPWTTDHIWLRRTFELSADFPRDHLYWLIHHDEDVEVYLNGEKVLELHGYTTDYEEVPLSRRAVELLRPGTNVIAVHCRQTGGGQYIDLGIARIIERE